MNDLESLKCCGNCISIYQLPDQNQNRCAKRKDIEVFTYGCCILWDQDGMNHKDRLEWGEPLEGIG